MTVQRVPTRSAIRDMMIPPMPEPSHASALASAGTERDPVRLIGDVLEALPRQSDAAVRHPKDKSATEATTQEAFVSTERGDCNIWGKLCWRTMAAYRLPEFHHPLPCGVCSTCCIASKCLNRRRDSETSNPVVNGSGYDRFRSKADIAIRRTNQFRLG